jgi:uncharacterized protein (TIGR04255 family)
MSEFQYIRPPITEAVIEFRFASLPDESKRSIAVKKLKKLYDNYDPTTRKEVEVKVLPKGSAETRVSESVVEKFRSADMTQQLLIYDRSFLMSQLAPYTGWQQLYNRLERDWIVWRKATGFHNVERIGVRYINRIDIPLEPLVTYYEHYVTVYPAVPKELDPCIRHSVNIQVKLDDIDSDLKVKTAMVESPIPVHVAIVLDIDVSKTFAEPSSDERLFDFLTEAREKKNQIFEACITDKARALFSNE